MIHLFAETALLAHCWAFSVGFIVPTPPTLIFRSIRFFRQNVKQRDTRL